jgi:hypothetical protein
LLNSHLTANSFSAICQACLGGDFNLSDFPKLVRAELTGISGTVRTQSSKRPILRSELVCMRKTILGLETGCTMNGVFAEIEPGHDRHDKKKVKAAF